MDIMEIILLVAGGAIFVLSFFIPDRKGASADALSGEDVRSMIDREMAAVRQSLDGTVDESVSIAMEKTERSLERLSNEKIMAVSEYSDTVLAEIHKTHEEVMFLYDMLNNKHTSLKNTVAEVNRAVREAEEATLALKQLAEAAETEAAQISEASGDMEPEKAVPEAVEEPTDGQDTDSGSEGAAEEGEYGSNKEKIKALYRQGRSVADIARELGLGVGEVKLVIDLFQKR